MITMEEQIKEVYVAITTVPRENSIEVGQKLFDRFKSTYTDHKQYLNDNQVIQSFKVDAGKSVAFAKVYQIALGFVFENTIRVNILTGEEVNIIKEFHNLLKNESFINAKLYGYNNKFIYDILHWRGRINKIGKEYEAPQFKDIALQPWKQTKSVSLIDEIVSGYGKISLLNALDSANINYDNIILGEDIFSYYDKGDTESLIKSGTETIKCLINLKRVLDVEDEIQDVNVSVTEVGEVAKQEINVLDHILSSGNLCNKTLQALKDFADISGEPKENILTLSLAALSKTKEYQKVPEEDIETLKEALDLKADYSKIQQIADKGNMGAKECKSLIKEYKDKPKKEKEDIVNLTVKFLTEKRKINQKRTSEALKLLKSSLLN